MKIVKALFEKNHKTRLIGPDLRKQAKTWFFSKEQLSFVISPVRWN